MSIKYNEHITITRTGENDIKIECSATKDHKVRSIVAIFMELMKIDDIAALLTIQALIGIAAEGRD